MEKQLDNKPDIEKLKAKIGFGIKFWLEFHNDDRKNILGSGWANLLENIDKPDVENPISLTQIGRAHV